jgi:hypothetical protein
MKLILLLIPFINGLSPSCINCKFYKPNKYDNYDSTSLSKCNYFEINKYVDGIRNDVKLCGPKGKYFVKEDNIIARKIKHKKKRYYTLVKDSLLILLMKLILFLIPFINGLYIIPPSCVKCKFYKPCNYDDYDTTFYSKCNYLGTEKYVDNMREYPHLCGVEGKYFEETNNVGLNRIKHNINKNYFFNVFILSCTFSYIFNIFFSAFRHYP